MATSTKDNGDIEASGRLRSRSPFRSLKPRNGGGRSPWRKLSTTNDDPQDTEDGPPKLHESEISILQQLCLDKHDENAAIEILLDESVPEVYPASSGSTEPGSRALSKMMVSSVEGKRTFLNRFFFKSSRKSPQRDGFNATETPPFMPKLVEVKDNGAPKSKPSKRIAKEPTSSVLTPPSMVPRSRTKYETSFSSALASVKQDLSTQARSVSNGLQRANTLSSLVRSDRSGTFSNVSSLSGSTGTSNYRTPLSLDRHESLGMESINDVRNCLKQMDRQLGQATDKGQRISRQKVMQALFTVADSLENDDEREALKNELRTVLEAKKDDSAQPVTPKSPAATTLRNNDDDANNKSEDSTSDGDFTIDSSPFGDDAEGYEADQSNGGISPFNIVWSVGNFFGVNSNNQEAVEEVLDDLVWTEFVFSRKGREAYAASLAPTFDSDHGRSQTIRPLHGQITLQVKKYTKSNGAGGASRGRSWWRTQPPNINTSPKPKADGGSDDDEESSSGYSSKDLQTYLPSNITVKNPPKEFTIVVEDAPSSAGSAHYHANLVDTESHFGFEMDKV